VSEYQSIQTIIQLIT